MPPIRRECHGIRQEIHEHLLEPHWICANGPLLVDEVDVEAQLMFVYRRAELLNG
jgi:hypothetical protein